MKIIDKIMDCRDRALNSEAEASRFQSESVAAVLNGMGSDEWRTYMSNFHSNPDQLQRLMGDDDDFMKPDSWGPTILAYVGSGGTCGGGTTFSLVVDMPEDFKELLDENVSSETNPDDGDDDDDEQP